MDQEFELKIYANKDAQETKIITWRGTSGENAARRYVDVHRDAIVIAWRYPRNVIQQGMRGARIIP